MRLTRQGSVLSAEVFNGRVDPSLATPMATVPGPRRYGLWVSNRPDGFLSARDGFRANLPALETLIVLRDSGFSGESGTAIESP